MKYNRCRISKRSQSLTGEQTTPEAFKQVKGFDKQTRDRTGKHPGRNEDARKLPRNKGSEKCLTKKFQVRQEGFKKQMKNVARLVVDDQAIKGRTKPHCESGVKSPVASNRDVLVMERERSFDDQSCEIQTILGGTQLLGQQSESQGKCVDLVSPVCRASTEKIHKSRLVPPRPAKDIILDNKAMVSSIKAAGNSLTQEKQTQHAAVRKGNGTPSSDRDVVQKSSSAVDHIFQSQEKDGNTCRDVSCSEGEVEPDTLALDVKEYKIKEFSTLTSVDSLKENECVGELPEIERDGRRFEDQDTKVLSDLVENETVVSMGKTFPSLEPQQQMVSEDLGSTRAEVLKNEGDLSCSGVSEGPSFETKLKPSGLYAFLPEEEAIIGGKSGTSEKLENWRTTEEEPVREAVQVQQKTQDNSSERPECNDQTETSNSSTPSVPVEMWKDWSCLEKTIQSILRGFVENQGFVAEISRIVPEVPESFYQWISDFEEALKNNAENVSDQCETVDQDSKGQMMGIKLTAEGELPLKDLPEESEITDDPESAAGHSTITKDCSVSGMLEVASVEVHPPISNVSVDSACEDVQDPAGSADQEATENTSGVTPRRCTFKVEVTESPPEQTPAVNSFDIEEESQSDPTVTSWSEDFVFVEFYFAEPGKIVESRSDWGLVDSSTKKPKEISAVGNRVKQRGIVLRGRSCDVHVEEAVETQLKRHRTSSTNSQSSKVRRLVEMTAEEIKVMAVPELLLMNLREGRLVEDQLIDESAGLNPEGQAELSVGDMDSCEEVLVEGVEVVPAVSSVTSGRRGFSVGSSKHKTDCRIS